MPRNAIDVMVDREYKTLSAQRTFLCDTIHRIDELLNFRKYYDRDTCDLDKLLNRAAMRDVLLNSRIVYKRLPTA